MLNWTATKEELELASKIADRYMRMLGDTSTNRTDVLMDVEAVHCNGCPLKLQELLEADDFNFSHDVSGIRRHLNRETGKLEDFFSPRYSA